MWGWVDSRVVLSHSPARPPGGGGPPPRAHPRHIGLLHVGDAEVVDHQRHQLALLDLALHSHSLAAVFLCSPFKLRDARLELGDALVFGPALLPPALPDPPLELHRVLENPPVLGLDPGALLLDAPPHAPPV